MGQRLLRRWLSHPLGHFYSPLGRPEELDTRRSTLWPEDPCVPGINFDTGGQRRLLREIFPPLLEAFDFREHSEEGQTFSLGNSQFSRADARALFALLRHWRPRRMIEIGCGYSTLLAAAVNREFLDGTLEITAIDPFPKPFLRQLEGLSSLRVERVQDTPDAIFDSLEPGDVLFIDSSHVLKTGSDLTHLLTRVLPCLRSGVRVHFHDIFLPDEYPSEWVIDMNRSWNEQYALQALLAANARYRILFGTNFALTRLAIDAQAAFGELAGHAYAGGNLWLEVQ